VLIYSPHAIVTYGGKDLIEMFMRGIVMPRNTLITIQIPQMQEQEAAKLQVTVGV
jgi:hypothetical protein